MNIIKNRTAHDKVKIRKLGKELVEAADKIASKKDPQILRNDVCNPVNKLISDNILPELKGYFNMHETFVLYGTDVLVNKRLELEKEGDLSLILGFAYELNRRVKKEGEPADLLENVSKTLKFIGEKLQAVI